MRPIRSQPPYRRHQRLAPDLTLRQALADRTPGCPAQPGYRLTICQGRTVTSSSPCTTLRSSAVARCRASASSTPWMMSIPWPGLSGRGPPATNRPRSWSRPMNAKCSRKSCPNGGRSCRHAGPGSCSSVNQISAWCSSVAAPPAGSGSPAGPAAGWAVLIVVQPSAHPSGSSLVSGTVLAGASPSLPGRGIPCDDSSRRRRADATQVNGERHRSPVRRTTSEPGGSDPLAWPAAR